MKLSIFTVKTSDDFNAGQKAPSDIVKIVKKKYNARVVFFEKYDNRKDINKLLKTILKVLKRFKFTIEFIKSRIKKEIVILQFPMFENTKLLNKLFMFNLHILNREKLIILIHDVDGLRSQNEELYKQDLERLSYAKYIIVHNKSMMNKLKEDGIKAKMYCLNIFDYLIDKPINNIHKMDKNKPKIIYAGNLSPVKSPFLHDLEDSKLDFKIELFGLGITKNISKKIVYKGKHLPNELPRYLKNGVGLIWDGLLDETDQDNGMKNYTKYNNPHKLSCYMAAGIPVIVWKKSAISDFVIKNKIGYTINSIYDINNIDFSNYEELCYNVSIVTKNVKNGFYTINVINKVLKDIQGD